MTIPVLPVLNRSASTFKTDVDTYFGTQLPAFSAAIQPEIDRINNLGYGSYNATSVTNVTIGTGSKSFTVDTGKGYAIGQVLMVASTASPSNYMVGQVTSYDSGTGALVANVTNTGGSGTAAAWTISVTALSAGGGVSPDSIVVLTSGTSWTCPAGVTKLVGYVEGGCGGGARGNGSSVSSGGGGGGGGVRFIASVSPGTSYTYAIGAGGAGSTGANGGGGESAGDTSITIGAVTYTGSGGGGGNPLALDGAGGNPGSGYGAGQVVRGNYGASTNGTTRAAQYGGRSAFGYGQGGTGGASNGSAGTAGRITLELYK